MSCPIFASRKVVHVVVYWHSLPHAAILAPMSGVTDWPFRRAVRRSGAVWWLPRCSQRRGIGECAHEMRKLRIEALAEAPLSIQLAGWEPQVMADAARMRIWCDIHRYQYGCPARRVTNCQARH